MNKEELIPQIGVVKEIVQETGDVKSFHVVGLDGKPIFKNIPGQCAMVSVPGVGEGMFSITSAPQNPDYNEFSIKKCGHLTSWLHDMEEGQEILVRGPYGNGFPVDTDFRGKDLVFIAGGIGLAPLRSIINYCRANPENYGHLDIIYGSRTKEDLVKRKEIEEEWAKDPHCSVYLTIDREEEGWDGHVGFVPTYASELGLSLDKIIIICGPPIMIHFTLEGLKKQGFKTSQVYTTMEMRMKCGIGKCGRCNIGDKYVCKDGPVFRYDKLDLLPPEF